MRAHHTSELGQMGVGAFAMDELAAELVLEKLDGAGQRRLRHIAAFRRPGEVELLAQR